MSDGPRYSIIPGAAVRDRRLQGRDLQVLCDLGTHTNREGWCRVSQAKMATALGCGRATISRSLGRLVACNYVERFSLTGADFSDEAPAARQKAGTIQVYRVKIDRPEEPSLDLPKNGQVREGQPAHSRWAPPAHPGRAPLTTSCNDQENSSSKNSLSETAFDRFWQAFPRRVGKKPAKKIFEKLVANGEATADELVAAAERYAASRAAEPPRFTKHPATWLADGRWLDEAGGSSSVTTDGSEDDVHVLRDDARWIALAVRWRRERGSGPGVDRHGGWRFPKSWVGEKATSIEIQTTALQRAVELRRAARS